MALRNCISTTVRHSSHERRSLSRSQKTTLFLIFPKLQSATHHRSLYAPDGTWNLIYEVSLTYQSTRGGHSPPLKWRNFIFVAADSKSSTASGGVYHLFLRLTLHWNALPPSRERATVPRQPSVPISFAPRIWLLLPKCCLLKTASWCTLETLKTRDAINCAGKMSEARRPLSFVDSQTLAG